MVEVKNFVNFSKDSIFLNHGSFNSFCFLSSALINEFWALLIGAISNLGFDELIGRLKDIFTPTFDYFL